MNSDSDSDEFIRGFKKVLHCVQFNYKILHESHRRLAKVPKWTADANHLLIINVNQ